MAVAALVVEFLFGMLRLIPKQHSAQIVGEAIRWNYTTWLNIAFLSLAAFLVWRFLRTGGPKMLRMMKAKSMGDPHDLSHPMQPGHGK
jgi:hypothetical protein